MENPSIAICEAKHGNKCDVCEKKLGVSATNSAQVILFLLQDVAEFDKMLQQIGPKTAAAVRKPVAGETSPFQVLIPSFLNVFVKQC